jgi:uncharacterized protein YjbI with pentapeptide repeats
MWLGVPLCAQTAREEPHAQEEVIDESCTLHPKLWIPTKEELQEAISDHRAWVGRMLSKATDSPDALNPPPIGNESLCNAFLARVDLTNVDLRWANLNGVNFYKAQLNGANLESAELNKADLKLCQTQQSQSE